jgi:cyanate lyase
MRGMSGRQEFGDASCRRSTSLVEPRPKGDRVKITMTGKYVLFEY